jgi:hypothetical protein
MRITPPLIRKKTEFAEYNPLPWWEGIKGRGKGFKRKGASGYLPNLRAIMVIINPRNT